MIEETVAQRPARVIVVSTFFPPIAHSATNRILSFWRYLPTAGHPVSVVTMKPKTVPITADDPPADRIKDKSVLRMARFDRPRGPALHKLKAVFNFALATFPTLELRDWRRRAARRTNELLASDPNSVVLSSFPPAAPHLVALAVLRHHPTTRWVADMRDAMVLTGDRNPLRRWAMTRLERRVLARADQVTSVSAPILRSIEARHLGTNARFVEIRNGYDFDLEPPAPRRSGPVRILYSGEFYGRRNPTLFLSALDEVCRTHDHDVEVRFLGPSRPIEVPDALRARVSTIARVPNAEAVAAMRDADLLLLISPSDGELGVYTGKLFEYLAAQRPILGIVPPDDVAADLIRCCRAGYVAAPDDRAAIVTVLRTALADALAEVKFEPDLDVIRRHHRRWQAERLARSIEELSDRETRSR